jgi:hypothetical protein
MQKHEGMTKLNENTQCEKAKIQQCEKVKIQQCQKAKNTLKEMQKST